jgi:lysine-specific demethylase/histidyl-hydroxylase NO66
LQEASGAPAIGPDSRVAPRPHLICSLREEGDGLVLLFGSTRLTFPAAVREPLTFALQGQPFAVRDLPGRLDDAGKLVLVRRLVKEGLLVRSAEPARERRPQPANTEATASRRR